MANPAHEALLRQGVDEWNDWRSQNGSVTPDLSGVCMPAASLQGVDLSHARLMEATLIRANLTGADLRYADLSGAQLHEVDLSDADLYRANLEDGVLANANLRRARCYAANFAHAQVTVADFRRADLRSARLADADLRESRGAGASLLEADLSGAELDECDLTGCNLTGVRGLVTRQLERAIVDDTTLFSDPMEASPREALESLLRTLQSLRARTTGNAVTDTDVSSYHAVLDELDGWGIDTRDSRIRDGELVRPASFAGIRPWVDGALFRRRLGDLLSSLGKE